MVNAIEWIVDAVGVLEYRLNIAAKCATLSAGQRVKIASLIKNLARCRRDQTEQQPRKCRLAAAAFADNGCDRGAVALNEE